MLDGIAARQAAGRTAGEALEAAAAALQEALGASDARASAEAASAVEAAADKAQVAAKLAGTRAADQAASEATKLVSAAHQAAAVMARVDASIEAIQLEVALLDSARTVDDLHAVQQAADDALAALNAVEAAAAEAGDLLRHACFGVMLTCMPSVLHWQSMRLASSVQVCVEQQRA